MLSSISILNNFSLNLIFIFYFILVSLVSFHVLPYELSRQQKKKFVVEVKHYFWEDPFLYNHFPDRIIKRYVLEEEVTSILNHCDLSPYGSHFRANRTAIKVLQSGFYWPTIFKGVHALV